MSFKCPYCPKEFRTKWQTVNHIKQSSGPHGRKFTFPEGYNVEDIKPTETSEQNLSNVSNVSTEGPVERQETSEQNLSNVQHIEPPKPPEVKMKNCPGCGAPKADWVRLDQLEDDDPQPTKEELEEYTHVCSKCMELIKAD